MTAVKKVERPATPRSNRKNFFLCCNNFVSNNYKNNCSFSFTASLWGNSNSLSKIVSSETRPYVSNNKKDSNLRSSLFYTSARHEKNEYDTRKTWETWVTNKQHERDISATRRTRLQHEWKILVLRYRKWKITRRETISFEELPFGNTLFPCQNALRKCTTKTEFSNGKSYVKRLYTRL